MTAGAWSAINTLGIREREFAWREALKPCPTNSWDLEKFAQEQIRGLVRQIFGGDADPVPKQVVFGAVDSSADVIGICRRVGALLASERSRSVAIVGSSASLVRETEFDSGHPDGGPSLSTSLKKVSPRLSGNCWLVDTPERISRGGESMHRFLARIREEFEYSIVAAPVSGECEEAIAMASQADGIILILSAQQTRRAAARRIKQKMDGSHVRLLGTVLSGREFPIPQKLYRRL